jgi:hydrogenase expression/formation protein HypD
VKYVDEYRNRGLVRNLLQDIRTHTTRPWTIMEICGGQTHAIVKHGLDALLPEEITLVHGPGCPVCVTPLALIDKAVAIASLPNVIFTSFGDMLRVPGSEKDLLSVKASGGDVRIVYSPLDAVALARQNPDKRVVFFAVGFETTAPANAMAVLQAERESLKNFFMLSAHVLVPPAIEAILSSPTNRVQAFLAAGHVCAVTGYEQYEPLAARFRAPIVVTGFEPVDILQGISMSVHQLEHGRADVENQYARVVRRAGNPAAQQAMMRVFEVIDREWRGIGLIPRSGYGLRPPYRRFDADEGFAVQHIATHEPEICIAGSVLQGIRKPHECSAFGTQCTPEHPLGAPMVSSEGACAAYIRYAKVSHDGSRA